MIKVLRLAWIAKLLRVYGYVLTFRTILAYIFKKYGGLHFLLSCNYDAKDFENVPSFYKDILLFFHELKALHGCHHGRDIILFNNKEILTDGRKRKRKSSRMTHHFYYFPTLSTKLNISIHLKNLFNIGKSSSVCYSLDLI